MPEMPVTAVCPKCGRALPPDAPRGLCAKCLFAAMLDGGPLDAPQSNAGPAALPRAFGAYELLEELARGGMGIVYRARQTQVNRVVAVKVMAAGQHAAPDFAARFRTEAEAVASMDHPNIVPIYEIGECEGQPFFSMKFVEGGSLAARISNLKFEISNREAAVLLAKLARAVHYAHQRGILHRDIKPGNVLLDAQGEPHLTDFGLAKLVEKDSTLTRTMAMLGTPSYMSPEQARGEAKQLTTAVDVYGLGAVSYELFTGQPPFAGGTTMETVRQVLEKEPRRPSALKPGLDRDLETICLKCLEKEPTRRYGSAEAVAEDLERWLRREPILARPVSAWENAAKWVRRHPLRSAGLSFVFVLLLAVVWGSIAFTLRLKKERDRADANASTARQEQANTRQALARAQTALAEAAYENQDGLSMRRALDAVPADLRDTTWHYLHAHADNSQAVWDRVRIGAAADPTRPGVFAVAEEGGRIEFIEAGSGRRLGEIPVTPHQRRANYFRGLAISPDGRRLAVGALSRGGIAIYDITNETAPVEWDAPETDLVEFSKDGALLLQSSGIDGVVCLWEAATGNLLWKLKSYTRAVFVPPGGQVVASRGNELVILDTTEGTVLRRLCRLRAEPMALAVHPDGRRLAVGDYEGVVYSVDLEDGRVAFERRGHDHHVRFLEFTTDGRRFVSVADAENKQASIHVWDTGTGTRLQSILGGPGHSQGLRIHPLTDDLLVTGPSSKSWALSRAEPKWVLPPAATGGFFGGESSCLGRMREGIGWYRLDETSPAPAWTTSVRGSFNLATSADGRVAAVTPYDNLGGELRILRQVDGAIQQALTLPVKAAVSIVRFSPSGDRVMVFTPGGTCSGHFDTATGASLPVPAKGAFVRVINDVGWLDHTRIVGAVTAFALRAAARSEERLVLWDAPTGNLLRWERNVSVIQCVAPAPDGRTFAEAGDDRMIRLRDAETLAVQGAFRAHDASITALAWHPTRPLLASASSDLTIKLWEIPGGRLLEELRGPVKPVTALHFSPGGGRLISAGTDQTRVWEPKALRPGVGATQ